MLVLIVVSPLTAVAWYQWEMRDRVFLGVSAMGVDIGGMTRAEAEAMLRQRAREIVARPVRIEAGDQSWATDWSQLGFGLPVERVLATALSYGREGIVTERLVDQLAAVMHGHAIDAAQSFDPAPIDAFVARAAAATERPMRNARLDLRPDLTFELTTAQAGRTMDVEQARRDLFAAASAGTSTVRLPVRAVQPETTDAMRLPAKERAERILAGPLRLDVESASWTIERQEIAGLLRFTGGPGKSLDVSVNLDPIAARVRAIAAEVERQPKDAVVGWDHGRGELVAREPSRDGRKLDVPGSMAAIREALEAPERIITLPTLTIKPELDANDLGRLGIRELVDRASTSFAGSLPQKEHNVRLAASRLDGYLIRPRQQFSFNKALGATTIQNGYQVAFGIASDGSNVPKTVPSVAGGICQVATTLFQPVFWSGYQLDERHWHLYWIPAYSSRGIVGLDATVDEDADLDFRFTNNTDTYLLVHTKADATTVTFELFGTKPAWDISVQGPVVANKQAPDTTQLFEQEPMLPEGKQYQVEVARDGFTSTLTRVVSESGVPRTLKLESRYAPSRNVTLIGTGGKPRVSGELPPVSGG
jgi:vancomycin resistance protein YoaR